MITSVFMVVTWSSLFDQFLHFACTIGINKFTSRFEFQIRLHYAVMITKTSDLYWLFKQDEVLQLESLKIQFVTSRKRLCVQRYCFRVDCEWLKSLLSLSQWQVKMSSCLWCQNEIDQIGERERGLWVVTIKVATAYRVLREVA